MQIQMICRPFHARIPLHAPAPPGPTTTTWRRTIRRHRSAAGPTRLRRPPRLRSPRGRQLRPNLHPCGSWWTRHGLPRRRVRLPTCRSCSPGSPWPCSYCARHRWPTSSWPHPAHRRPSHDDTRSLQQRCPRPPRSHAPTSAMGSPLPILHAPDTRPIRNHPHPTLTQPRRRNSHNQGNSSNRPLIPFSQSPRPQSPRPQSRSMC